MRLFAARYGYAKQAASRDSAMFACDDLIMTGLPRGRHDIRLCYVDGDRGDARLIFSDAMVAPGV